MTKESLNQAVRRHLRETAEASESSASTAPKGPHDLRELRELILLLVTLHSKSGRRALAVWARDAYLLPHFPGLVEQDEDFQRWWAEESLNHEVVWNQGSATINDAHVAALHFSFEVEHAPQSMTTALQLARWLERCALFAEKSAQAKVARAVRAKKLAERDAEIVRRIDRGALPKQLTEITPPRIAKLSERHVQRIVAKAKKGTPQSKR